MRHRPIEIGIALVLAFVVMACSGAARQKTIRITYETLNVAADKLTAYSKSHEREIVDKALARQATKAEVVAELADFRAKVDKAEIAIVAGFRMTAAASIINDDQSLSALLRVAALVATELKELGIP